MSEPTVWVILEESWLVPDDPGQLRQAIREAQSELKRLAKELREFKPSGHTIGPLMDTGRTMAYRDAADALGVPKDKEEAA